MYYKNIFNKLTQGLLCQKHLFVIIILGTFNKLGGAKLQEKGGDTNEQERFFNHFSSNHYLPFNILTIYSFDIKEIHLAHPMT